MPEQPPPDELRPGGPRGGAGADEAAQPADVEVCGLSDQLCQAGHGEAYNAEGPLGQGPGELQPIVGCPPAEFTTSAAAALIKHQIYPVV